jgi:D-alanine transaminase
MSRVTYVNGRYLPHGAAAVHVEDRGFQFADGVYEVCEVRAGHLIDAPRHVERLHRSLRELAIASPMSDGALDVVLRQIIARNLIRDGYVYVQVTRGIAPRDHAFPLPPVRPTLVVSARALDPLANEAKARKGVRVITLPDERWKRPDIKSTSLLPNVLARQAARAAGAYEAWLVDEQGFVTEGSASNAWIITRAGVVVTRQAEHAILRGVTRTTLLDALKAHDLRLEERPFTVAEANGAAEAFVTGATTIVLPVVQIDDARIGEGTPGPISLMLRSCFHQFAAIAR